MTFKSTAKALLKGLANHFNIFATDLPSGNVRKEMEEEGWKFGLTYHPYRRATVPPVEWAITPEGRPALGPKAAPEDTQRLKDTITLKKGQLQP